MNNSTRRQVETWLVSLSSQVSPDLLSNPSLWAFRQWNPIAAKTLWHSTTIAILLFFREPPPGYLCKLGPKSNREEIAAMEQVATAVTAKASAALLAVGTAFANKHHSKVREEGK